MKARSCGLVLAAALCMTGCVRWGGDCLPSVRSPHPPAVEPGGDEIILALQPTLVDLDAALSDLDRMEVEVP